MTQSRIQTATCRLVAQCLKKLSPSLSEKKRDSNSVMCKENLLKQSHFYVDRQMYYVMLLTIFIQYFKKLKYKN